jgi:hypothetical protein
MFDFELAIDESAIDGRTPIEYLTIFIQPPPSEGTGKMIW